MEHRILTLEEKKQASLDVLFFFHDFCEKNSLRYFLAYGTLIGAVRHRGFIPWDDDIDIHMPRPDYDRLQELFEDTESFRLITCMNDSRYMFPWAKILNGKTARLTGDGEQDSIGIGIDIFPLEGLPDDTDPAEKRFLKNNGLFLNVVSRFTYYMGLPSNGLFNRIRKASGSLMFRTGILKKTALKCCDTAYCADYDSASKVACMVGSYIGKMKALDREWFNGIPAPFENGSFIIPEGYDGILRAYYGDYMQLPPEDQRTSTHEDRFVWLD